jgi:glycosyltransferase involved in cell wall biosynthesis
VLGLSQV